MIFCASQNPKLMPDLHKPPTSYRVLVPPDDPPEDDLSGFGVYCLHTTADLAFHDLLDRQKAPILELDLHISSDTNH